MLGERTRRRKRGSNTAGGMEGAMRVVAAVVAMLDVVVGREREGKAAEASKTAVLAENKRASCCGRALIGATFSLWLAALAWRSGRGCRPRLNRARLGVRVGARR